MIIMPFEIEVILLTEFIHNILDYADEFIFCRVLSAVVCLKLQKEFMSFISF